MSENERKAYSGVTPNLGNFGGSIDLTLEGKTIHVRLIDQKAKAAFEKKLVSQARALLHEDKENLTSEEFAKAYADFTDSVVSGKYAFGSEIATKVISSLRGIALFLSCLSEVSADEWDALFISYPIEVKTFFQQLFTLSFPKMTEVTENEKKN